MYVCMWCYTVLCHRYGSTMAGLNPSIDYTAPLADRGTYNTAAPSTLTDPPGMDGGRYCIHLLTACLSIEYTPFYVCPYNISTLCFSASTYLLQYSCMHFFNTFTYCPTCSLILSFYYYVVLPLD